TDIRLHRVDTPPAGFKWYFLCPGTWSHPDCGRMVRQLYLPESPPGITPRWGCRHCWHLLYRDPRRDYRRDAIDRLVSLDALEADLRRLREITLQGLDVESP